MHGCANCGNQTPDGAFCIYCGTHADDPDTGHTRYAAAPHQHRSVPWLGSTLFPHLPRHVERHFHIALAVGSAAVVVLGALQLFSVALLAAALLLPALTLLYFHDAAIYERAPMPGLGFTALWGAAAGTAVGFLSKAVQPIGTAMLNRSSGAHFWTGGVLIPLIGVLVVVIGPLFLLRHKAFNDTLDGAAFGVMTAATAGAAQTIVVSSAAIGAGMTPVGAVLPWIERLLAIAVATPVLLMSAIGIASAAVWLRERAPVADRAKLGIFGNPFIALPIAAVLVIVGALGEPLLPAGAWLAVLVVLDLLSLWVLRRAIHLGLTEEAREKPIGAPTRCLNCHEETPVHTFCVNCGVAIRATPHSRSRVKLAVAVGLTLLVVGIGFGVAALAAPPAPKPQCHRGVECGNPPRFPHMISAFPGYSSWHSSALNYSLRFDNQVWQVASQTPQGLEIETPDGSGIIIVMGGQGSPQSLIDGEVSSLQGQLLGFAQDNDPHDTLLGTEVGLVPGPGGIYTGTLSSPQGPQAPVAAAVVAAQRNGTSIVATAVAPADDPSKRAAIYQQADDIINSVQWQ